MLIHRMKEFSPMVFKFNLMDKLLKKNPKTREQIKSNMEKAML